MGLASLALSSPFANGTRAAAHSIVEMLCGLCGNSKLIASWAAVLLPVS